MCVYPSFHYNIAVRQMLSEGLASPDTVSEATGSSLLHLVKIYFLHVVLELTTTTCTVLWPIMFA